MTVCAPIDETTGFVIDLGLFYPTGDNLSRFILERTGGARRTTRGNQRDRREDQTLRARYRVE